MSLSSTKSEHESLKERLHLRKRMGDDHQHPVNVVHHDEATLGERIADKAASGIGSWRFLIVQTILVSLWVIFNIYGLIIRRWDPFPFILLNLLFSVQAAYTGPVLLLAGNRQAQKDRLTLEHAASEADKADQQNTEIIDAIRKNTELTERNTEIALRILNHLQEQVTAHIAADQARESADRP